LNQHGAVSADRFDRLRTALCISIDDADLRALLGETLGAREANALRATGDQCDF
jgi:hypothetical protein